jgi:phage FluMu protein Com
MEKVICAWCNKEMDYIKTNGRNLLEFKCKQCPVIIHIKE